MQNLSDSRAELMELERESYRRNQARDLAWLKNMHAEDALMFNPGSDIQRADAFFAERLKAEPETPDEKAPKFSWEPTNASVCASDDMGWVHGVITISFPDGRQAFGKYVSVWIKEDGQWKVVAEIRNSNT